MNLVENPFYIHRYKNHEIALIVNKKSITNNYSINEDLNQDINEEFLLNM